MRFQVFLSVLLGSFIAACGGNVVMDASGVSGTGGATSPSTSTSTSSGASSVCGATQCTPGFVCLHHIGGPVTTVPEKCVPNPCGSSPLSCSCATSVCPTDSADTCAVMGGDLFCGCPACQ